MDKVFIVDLVARGIIGISDAEREKPQDILINIVLHTDIRAAGNSDRLEDCINYDTIAGLIQAHAESAKCHTVEALATDLARICLQEPAVQRVTVRVEKPGAVRFTRSVGVEIERSRVDFV